MFLMQIRQSKEQFNNEVMAMKTRKAMLLQELEDIQLQLIDIQVHSICSSFWLLADESRDFLSLAETKITVPRAEQNHKLTTIFTQNGKKLTFCVKIVVFFFDLLSFSNR